MQGQIAFGNSSRLKRRQMANWVFQTTLVVLIISCTNWGLFSNPQFKQTTVCYDPTSVKSADELQVGVK